MNDWMNQDLNETYCWYSIGIHPRWNIFLNKQCKKKIPYPDQFYFSFLSDKTKSWWMYLNVGLKTYSFDLLFSNNFSKWIKFGFGGNMYKWLYIHSWLYMSVLWWCRIQISAEQKILKRYCKSTRIMNVNWLFKL